MGDLKGIMMRRGEVKELFGVSDTVLQKWVAEGVLHPRKLVEGGQKFFVRDEVEKLAESLRG